MTVRMLDPSVPSESPAGRTMRVGLLQQRWRGEEEVMRQATEAAVRRVAKGGAQLVICQELQAGPYFCQREDVALHDLAEPMWCW